MVERKKKASTALTRVAQLKQALQAAATSSGSAGGGRRLWLKIDDRTGAATVGADAAPFPLNDRYAIRVGSFVYGYIVFGEPAGTREVMVSMLEQPVMPVPPGGYVQTFGEPGAKLSKRITLTSLDIPGYEVEFDAMGKSSRNRIDDLLGKVLENLDTEIGEAGYIHPVVKVKVGNYHHKVQNRKIHHWDYSLVGWMDDAGTVVPAAPLDPTTPWAAPAA